MAKMNDKLMFDIDAINTFIFNDEDKRDNEVEINESVNYDENGNIIGKTKITREVKSKNNDRVQIRYDMLSKFIDILNDVEIDQDIMPLSLTQQIILNTMAENGLLKEKK
jgi:hypothetical protein